MKFDHITQAPMTKRMLLNASQRKYLSQRIASHAEKLMPRQSWRQDEEDEDPPEILAALKLIEDYRDKVKRDREESARFRKNTVSRFAERLQEALLFEASETALQKVADFEEMTWEDLQTSGTSRPLCPNWDKDI